MIIITKIFFVRHAQPDHDWQEDRTRPLTMEGLDDAKIVVGFFKDKHIDMFYCSPYKRSLQTIEETARHFQKEIIIDERLRERESGQNGNYHGMIQKRWDDKNYHEEGGESITMVQHRNIEAIFDILEANQGKTLVIGTHGTALSSILNYFDDTYNCDSFFRIIDWMPYIIELDFEGKNLINKKEHLHVQKDYLGKKKADK